MIKNVHRYLDIAVIQELLLERQENIYKIGVYYQPDQSIITKVRTVLCCHIKFHSKSSSSSIRSQKTPRCQYQTRSAGWEA